MGKIATVNPTTGEIIEEFQPLTPDEIETKLAQAKATFQDYRRIPMDHRAQWLRQAAHILETQKERFGALITLEMGKTIQSAIAEVEKCALVCRYYAQEGPRFLADLTVTTDASYSCIRYQPLGVILAVMPWNFPFWQVFRFAAPLLIAGNVGLLKHASNVPQSALAIEEILLHAGFPLGAFQTLLIDAHQVAAIVSDERIKAATLTGSEEAGMSLGAVCGHHLKKTVLELGGSDPFIVLPTADLTTAATTAATARLMNNGQSCIAAKRFILEKSIADEFSQLLVDQFRLLRVGDPMDRETDIGPLATPSILHELDGLVQTCIHQGARVLIGGELSPHVGNFYPPTILTDLPLGSPAYHQEFFGPVALLFPVEGLEEAIQLANSTPFGLGASAWTNDSTEQDRLIQELEAGSVFINGMVKSDPRLPFGGIKRSGYGRELGVQGLYEFLNIKTIWIH
jgi:succinate-semialdehyde dehydrogenase/glutarate-semialdehyde dehydrogenase